MPSIEKFGRFLDFIHDEVKHGPVISVISMLTFKYKKTKADMAIRGF